MPSTVSFHRVLRCPPARLFRALTQAEALAKWLPPHGYTGQVHQPRQIRPGKRRKAATLLDSGKRAAMKADPGAQAKILDPLKRDA